jgi:hypothetical protein
VSLDRLQRLEACEARVDVQERQIEMLQKQIAETEAALKLELARGEKHAEALMHIARTCDERTSEMKEQRAALRVKDAAMAKMEATLLELTASHAAAITNLEAGQKDAITKLEVQHSDAITKIEGQHKDAITKLEAEIAALKAQAASTLSEILAAVTTGAMEILPVRPDRRQFVEWRVGGIPPPPAPPQFDRAWCAAVCAGSWKADVDAATGDARANVTHKGGSAFLTLRSATPLPRGPPPRFGSGREQQHPTFRVVVEAYGRPGLCRLGFLPSHAMHGGDEATAVAPKPGHGIANYGGWCIKVHASRAEDVSNPVLTGWTVIPPGESAYATTDEVPPVPAGGAVEFAVDYAAGTCRVAFYTPAAAAGGFVEVAHAKMELRFEATTAGKDWNGRAVPVRSVPTAEDSRVALYPAVEAYDHGNVWRFAAV